MNILNFNGSKNNKIFINIYFIINEIYNILIK